MTYNIKPMRTPYKGLSLRSRLEGHWAVLFDTLGIDFVYEPEGFVINEETYLPDFFIPEWDCYVEIKPQGYSEHDPRHKGLSTAGKDLILFAGYPRAKYNDSFNGFGFRSLFKTTVYHDAEPVIDFVPASIADNGTDFSLLFLKDEQTIGCYRFAERRIDMTENLPTISKRILNAYDREAHTQFLGGKDGRINDYP